MGETLYFECNSGISGDMTVAALLDLGADREVLDRAISSLPQDGFQIEISRVKKAGLDCCDFAVKLDAAHENHDHDMEYLHGTSVKEHSHNHEHMHAHRGLAEFLHILDACDMTDSARALAKKIVQILAEAEAKAHGVPLEEVHFHEVGAIDSIVDIVAAAVCMDNLRITEVIVPRLCEGSGTVRCQHGVLSVPVPAVVNILERHRIPLEIMPIQGEFVTPTGAAIVAAVQTGNTLPAHMQIKKVGMGAGKREYERPSILRAMLLESGEREAEIYKLESNIDDCSGEELGYVMERLLEAGARDVCYSPVYMKKNRPAWLLTVICMPEEIEKLEQIIFRETTTIGIRRIKMERSVLPRKMETVQLPYGEVVVKCCRLPDGKHRYYPEYDSVAALCRENGLPYHGLYEQAVLAAKEQLG